MYFWKQKQVTLPVCKHLDWSVQTTLYLTLCIINTLLSPSKDFLCHPRFAVSIDRVSMSPEHCYPIDRVSMSPERCCLHRPRFYVTRKWPFLSPEYPNHMRLGLSPSTEFLCHPRVAVPSTEFLCHPSVAVPSTEILCHPSVAVSIDWVSISPERCCPIDWVSMSPERCCPIDWVSVSPERCCPIDRFSMSPASGCLYQLSI
jgi:hypothetical protein